MERVDKQGNIYITLNAARYYPDEGYNQGKRNDKIRRKENRKPYEKKELGRDNVRRENRKDEYGRVKRCRFCELKYDYQRDCPEWKEKTKVAGAIKGKYCEKMENIEEEMDKIEKACTFETTNIRQKILIKDEIAQIGNEARNCAALDTGCTNSVAGKSWLEAYLQESAKEDNGEMIGPLSLNKVFKLGKGGISRSIGIYLLPINVAGKLWIMKLDIINASIPSLILKGTMKEMKMVIDLEGEGRQDR